MTNSALDIQEDGNHYKSLAIQPVEYCFKNKIPYLEGNVIKYVTRHKNKNKEKDIKKAIHYLQLILELEYGIKPDQYNSDSEEAKLVINLDRNSSNCVVFNHSDLLRLNREETNKLSELFYKIRSRKLEEKDSPSIKKAIVIEEDWPEYEEVWSMIEKRMTNQQIIDSLA